MQNDPPESFPGGLPIFPALQSVNIDCLIWVKAAPHNGARRFGKRFCPKRKYEKCGNTLCISHFSYCTIGVKDLPKPAVPIMRCCLKGICKEAFACCGEKKAIRR